MNCCQFTVSYAYSYSPFRLSFPSFFSSLSSMFRLFAPYISCRICWSVRSSSNSQTTFFRLSIVITRSTGLSLFFQASLLEYAQSTNRLKAFWISYRESFSLIFTIMISKNSWKSILIQSYLFYSLPDPRSFISLFIYSLLGSNPKALKTTFKFLAQMVPEPWTSKKSKAFLISFFWDSVRTCWLCIILFRLRTGAGVFELVFFIIDILIMSFTIKTISAVLTHDTEGLLDDMDPYVVLTIGTKKEKGTVAEDGGKKPVFNDTFTFKETDGDLLNIQVWDYDHMSQDDLIGSGALSLSSYRSTPGQQVVEWVELTYKGKGAGRLRISITYSPKTFMAVPTAPTIAYQYPQQAGFGNPFVTPTYPPGYPQPTYPPQYTPYPQQMMPGYPQQTMPTYPQQMMPGYPQQTMPGYPQQTMPGYPQQTMPGYPYPQYPPQ